LKLLFLLFASLKLGKVLVSVGSMLLTVWVYAALYGLPFAAGLVGMILIHEMGHYAAAKQRGLDVGLPAFIPFVGAWINLREQPRNAETEAHVAFAGPFVGALGAFAAWFWARHAGSDLWLAIAYTGFLLNLFNLIPVSPLDGGRITQVLSPRIWLLGAPLLVALFFWRPSPMLILIVIMAVPNLLAAWRHDPKSPQSMAYRDTPLATRVEYAIMYLGLAAVLAIMAHETHGLLAAGARLG
jgi:Zn-dependent protease